MQVMENSNLLAVSMRGILVTDNDQAIATGLYLFTVKNSKTGDIKTGKFLIVK
ncbi:MAG: hypothetical protein MZV64_07720 [Ignavibacteriales bacterium]|nr:hypothetical protein [Ignavibacteriales bacterium]